MAHGRSSGPQATGRTGRGQHGNTGEELPKRSDLEVTLLGPSFGWFLGL